MELDQDAPIGAGIDALAEVTVQVGINLRPGQQLVVLSPDGGVPLETIPLIRRVTEHAYRAGASLVHIDTMIGSKETDVDGITATGRTEPIMRSGEFLKTFDET